MSMGMRIGQVCFQRYPSPTHVGGGDVRRWQDLCSLHALGHDVHVVVCDPTNERTPELDRVASSVTMLRSGQMVPGTPRWLASRMFNPSSLALAYPDLRGLRSSVSRVLDEIHPDLIWAEEAFAVLLSSGSAPIVHSHLDFHFKLQSVRNHSFAAKRLRRPQALSAKRLQELEVDVCRRSAHTMCASRSEAEFLQGLGISASYLPVTGPTTPQPDYSRLSEGRLFLFGNPNTAMRAARHDLKTRIWPEIERLGVELQWHQLGKTPREGSDPSWEWLQEHFVVHGFVDSLDDVLLPGDASIMPYPFDTGGRAKFAVSAGYGAVNIAYDKTFECSEEFTHGVDCLSARDPAHFAELVNEFASDEALRLRLAKGSRAVYERHFTMEALYPEYERILAVATTPDSKVMPCAS
jgi:glycosyltransferase involved in cell wall biosynthesis